MGILYLIFIKQNRKTIKIDDTGLITCFDAFQIRKNKRTKNQCPLGSNISAMNYLLFNLIKIICYLQNYYM